MNWQTIVQQNNLAVSSVNYSDLNEETRLDAEYHRPEAIRYLELIEKKNDKTLADVAKFVVGPFGSTVTVDKYVDDADYCYVRNLDINSFEINNPEAHIPQELYEKLKQFHIMQNDLLVTVVGTLGKVAIAQEKDTKSIFSCKSTIIRSDSVDPYFLATFLNSRVGQTLLLRCKRGAIQEGLNLFDLKTLPVAIPSEDLQIKIRKMIEDAFTYSTKGIDDYRLAEQLLLADLNLADYIPSDTNTSTRKLSDCLTDDRFDAEYWQPKYDDIAQAIKSYRNGFDTFDNLFVMGNQTTIKPDEEYSYVELADVNSSLGTIENYTEMQGKELPSRGRMPLRQNDVIMSSLDGSLNKTALVTIDKQNIIGSTGFFVLRKKYFEPEVALVLLKSGPVQEIVGRQAQGTILTAIPKSSLSRILLPKIATDTQAKIKKLVVGAHKNKAIAQLTLEKAKRAVEVFVEQDETQALAYLAS